MLQKWTLWIKLAIGMENKATYGIVEGWVIVQGNCRGGLGFAEKLQTLITFSVVIEVAYVIPTTNSGRL